MVLAKKILPMKISIITVIIYKKKKKKKKKKIMSKCNISIQQQDWSFSQSLAPFFFFTV